MNLEALFLWFESASGLEVNLTKSLIIPSDNVCNIHNLVRILGCKVGSLGAKFKERVIWDPILEKVQKNRRSKV